MASRRNIKTTKITLHKRQFGNEKQKPPPIPPLQEGANTYKDMQDKLEVLARHFEATYRQPAPPNSLSPPPSDSEDGHDQAPSEQLLPNYQFGFRKAHSTTHAIARATHIVFNAIANKCQAAALLLYLARAFDLVHHGHLITNLTATGISRHIICIIHSFLTNRTTQVKYQNHLSTHHPAEAGAPQGAIFSPILFALFIRLLPIPGDVKITLYADDTIMLATDKNKTALSNKLKESFHIIDSFFTSSGISLNIQKTKALYFSRNTADLPPPPLPLGTNLINWSDSVRYLGVTLDPKLKISQHIQETAGKARRAISKIYHIISPTREIDLRTRITVFNSFVLPLLTYAAPVWTPYLR
ncbi:hypothetical protein PR048_001067 [Dryococelus australis]|uniref:Reverse transcriptase domain-containing protein n=1 Tax=Dryococelus australis TaxID=614101 RepID=A0ABQ9IGB0_9NEOP|nr:hypothetical protein PR048_001067 [Dryococelus australis]